MADQVHSSEPTVEELFRLYVADRDPGIRDQLIGRHTYLVEVVAKKFAGLGESGDDLVQEGTLGLINAVDMFDVSRGVKFSTYATHLIAGQIQHYLRDKGKLIRQPAWVQELLAKITRATEALTQELGRSPTNAEIAERLNLTETSVTELLKARERSKVTSLDAQADTDSDTAGAALNPDKIKSAHLVSLQLPIEDKIMLQDAIDKLKDLERKVVRYFFYYDLNQTEIARKLEISVNYASYLLRGALNKLRAGFEKQAQAEAAAELAPALAAVARGHRPAAPTPARGDGGSLPGEPYLRELVAQHAAQASRYPGQFSLLLVHLDARRGAVVPPALATGVGLLLRRNVRSVDLVASLAAGRYGLLLPHTGREARILADRLLQRITLTDWSAQCPAQATWTASIGIAIFPQDGNTDAALFTAAEKALRCSQEAGGNCASPAPRPTPGRPAPALRR